MHFLITATLFLPIILAQRQFQLEQNQQPTKQDSHHKTPPQIDTSTRCNFSQICEFEFEQCNNNNIDKDIDNLGCIFDNQIRKQHVKNAIKWSWDAYKTHAYGKDDLRPLSQSYKKWMGLSNTLIDALDTLFMAGFYDEFNEGIEWIKENLEFENSSWMSLFELNIRVLGGLLSAYNLSGGDKIIGLKAAELGTRMIVAFENSNRPPPRSRINLKEIKALGDGNLAERGTLILEFAFLSQIINFPEFSLPVYQVFNLTSQFESVIPGLYPNYFNSKNLASVGATADSFYEYLLKHWIQTGKKDNFLLEMYQKFIRGVRDGLIQNTNPENPELGLYYVAEKNFQLVNKMDHLACFFPGLIALGFHHGIDTSKDGEFNDLVLAEKLTYTCYMMYKTMPSGLAPEKVRFLNFSDNIGTRYHSRYVGAGFMEIDGMQGQNILRPETVESLYVLYRVTKNETYREWGWQIFRAFEKFSKVQEGGYASVQNVIMVPPKQKDEMESFWLAETLKYLYLLFSDEDIFPMDQYVFNTEAHPLPIFNAEKENELQKNYLENIWGDTGLQLQQSVLIEKVNAYQKLMMN